MCLHRSLILFSCIAVFCVFLSAQEYDKQCGHIPYLQHLSKSNPNIYSQIEETQQDIVKHEKLMEEASTSRKVRVIPVVVHVVWRTPEQNISDKQIHSQIRILNEDYRRKHGTPGYNRHAKGADPMIEFRLAKVDPNWQPTSGITRTRTKVNGFFFTDYVKFNETGGKNAWDTSKYLNLWVCKLKSGLLGYAQFPNGKAGRGEDPYLVTDGVAVDYRAFGDRGTAKFPYNKGRTSTHEVGHWLGLRHIWGDGGCSKDDGIDDTPSSDSPNKGFPKHPLIKCDSDDMFENYMDYTCDSVQNIFTKGQAARMHATLELYRVGLFDWDAFGSGAQEEGEKATDMTSTGAKREIVEKIVQTLKLQFGNVPRSVIRDIESIQSLDALEALAQEAALASSLNEFRASLRRRKR